MPILTAIRIVLLVPKNHGMTMKTTTTIRLMLLVAIMVAVTIGCRSNRAVWDHSHELLPPGAGAASYLNLDQAPTVCDEGDEPIDSGLSPLEVSDYSALSHLDLTLDECIRMAIENSKVFRDLGGTILRSPNTLSNVFGPAAIYADPRFSEEAALAAFDANVFANGYFQKIDRASNLSFQGDGGIIQQDLHNMQFGLQKLSATGTTFSLRHGINYDAPNQLGSIVGNTWESIVEGEIRQPLLQGRGSMFNRIAGPSTQSGVYNGVLLARANTEIGLLEFVAGVRDLVSEVENAYWDLYFSYRNLEANVVGRNEAYEVVLKAEAEAESKGAQAVTQAREQYMRFESVVLDAMEGRPLSGTRNNNGFASGVFQSSGGVRVAERRLRLLVGLPINGNQLIRTTDTPASSGVQFDWQQSVDEALQFREEVVQQRWLVKQKELELMASKNFLMPRFDLVGQYRMRGLGKDLTGGGTTWQDDPANSSAWGDLTSGDFQEWQIGAEMSMPVGFRRAHLGVRHAELQLSRERAVLYEQKREVVHDLSNAISELRRAHAALKAAENRYIAAREFLSSMEAEVEQGRDLDIQMEAQRRVVESEIQYRRAEVEYSLALKSVHYSKGTYLEYCNVFLSESLSDPDSGESLMKRMASQGAPINYASQTPVIAGPKPSLNQWLEPAPIGNVDLQ